MFASHLVLGLSLIGFSIWLQRTEVLGWPNESPQSELDIDYLRTRGRSRRRVNLILFVCGVLILIAGIAGPKVFIGAWLLVTVALIVVLGLALQDAFRTRRYLEQKLPEIRRRMWDGEE